MGDEYAFAVHDGLLRTLDAIHLGSALPIRAELSVFVGYDHRLNEAAKAAGLQPTMPTARRIRWELLGRRSMRRSRKLLRRATGVGQPRA